MKKTIYLLLLCATSLLFSCLEDDFDRTSIQETIQNADREERFFLMRDYSANGMSSVPNNFIGNNFIEKLKSFNQKRHFVCELSDQKGLPL